jgi:hypothetical protein
LAALAAVLFPPTGVGAINSDLEAPVKAWNFQFTDAIPWLLNDSLPIGVISDFALAPNENAAPNNFGAESRKSGTVMRLCGLNIVRNAENYTEFILISSSTGTSTR